MRTTAKKMEHKTRKKQPVKVHSARKLIKKNLHVPACAGKLIKKKLAGGETNKKN